MGGNDGNTTSKLCHFLTSVIPVVVAVTCGTMMPASASASPVCDRISLAPSSYASRIASVACAENSLWYGPFIDPQGRLASLTVSETERARLQDGVTPAWKRVADYWKGSGLLSQMSAFAGADDCAYPEGGHLQSASCRAFLADTPWSAAFVSFVMARAGVPGFNASASHIDFVRDAYRNPQGSPYGFDDPDATSPAVGDLLCYARGAHPIGPQGLRAFLGNGSGEGLNMHCDIVVAANPGGDRRLYLVGGNVLQGVTMRVLPLNRKGALWGLPHRTDFAEDCRPGNETACNFNRQDWVALLKLKPLPAPAGAMPVSGPSAPQCCTRCPLPMLENLRRCPAQPRPAEKLTPPGDVHP